MTGAFDTARAFDATGTFAATGAFAVSFAVGMAVIGVVVVAIAGLIVALWRRSAGATGTTTASEVGLRAQVDALPAGPPVAAATTDRSATPRPEPERGPHPSGLGVAELAAMVEEGMASLRSDLDTLREIIESVAAASTVPDDLRSRPAGEQVACIDQLAATIVGDLARARSLARIVGVDVDRGDRARTVVHDELARVGLPDGYFVAMDTTAGELAVDLVRARLAVERLERRQRALSPLFSGVRPTLALLVELGDVLAHAAATADPWRQASGVVDLVPDSERLSG